MCVCGADSGAVGDGVYQSYAMQSGRELRVMVIPEKIDDVGAFKLASLRRCACLLRRSFLWLFFAAPFVFLLVVLYNFVDERFVSAWYRMRIVPIMAFSADISAGTLVPVVAVR